MHQKTVLPTTKQYTILLIDDAAEDRVAYCRYLEHGSAHQYQVLEASSAAMGLDLYQRLLPNAILLDYSLPDLDGLEFLAVLQQAGKRVPVLMLTGQGDETIAAQAIKSGAQDYLIKGNLTANGLCKALEQAIEQWQLQQQLQQQEQQQQIVSAIALRIRQALTLQTILDTSVAEVRQYLSADRVVIYQFAPDMSGQIVAEAVLPEWLVSLHSQMEDTCFRQNLGGDYRLGRTRAIDNIYEAGLTHCHIKLLERFQVKANLVVPLLITEPHSDSAEPHHDADLPQLWGLLVAHQCAATRQWQAFEVDLLNQVAIQMAIAIQQAELYRQLQNELTERRRTETTLRESEAFLRLFVQNVPAGIAMFDREMRYIMASQQWIDHYNLDSVESLLHRSHYAVFPEIPERWRQIHQRCLAGAIDRCDDDLFIRADGKRQWLSWEVRPWYTAANNIGGIIIFSVDTTARKQAEIELRDRERLFSTLAEALPVVIFRFDQNSHCVYINDYWTVLTGRTSESVAGLGWVETLHPQERDRLTHAWLEWSQNSQHRGLYQNEGRLVHSSGKDIWYQIQALPEVDTQGKTVGFIGVMLDITDRKQVEASLQQLNEVLETKVQERTAKLHASEASLRAAQRIAHLGNWELDLTTQTITWSEELFRLFECDPAQGEPEYAEHLQSFSPASRHRLERAVEKAATLGIPYEVELQFWRTDGSVGWLLGRGEAVRNEQGAIVKLIGTALDITKRKQAEVALQESESRFAALAAAAPVAIFRFDAAVNCVYVNERWSEMTGRPAAEGLGLQWAEAIHPEDREWISVEVGQWLQTCKVGDRYRTEARILRPDDDILWYFCQMLPEADSRGTITGYVGTLTDITDRKQAEEALRNLSNRLTLAVKSGAIAIWDWNVAENILTWDDRMYELYGITPDQFTSVYATWASSLHPDDRPFAEAAIQQALAGEKDYDPEFRVIHPDGTVHFIKAYALVQRNAQGEPQQMIGINYDITDRKQAEQALQQLTLELQRSNQELEQFAYVASHDLQEPLRAITSYTQLLAKRYQGQLDAKADKYIDYVVDGAARMQQLIRDLLAYSRVGRYELKRRPTDCNAILEQVRHDLQVEIAKSNAVIIVDALPTILADTAQVTQLFQNLIGNALKYRGQAPPMVKVSVKQQGNDWAFSIQDNGIGIEPQYAERIFEIFQRLHTRREYEGTGLGLAICKKIIERHHGRLWVESQLGQGATFCFTLPASLNDEYFFD